MFKAKNINEGSILVKDDLDAYLSSREEGIFGTFLEGLAIYTCNNVYNGRKSSAEGIDLEFERENVYCIVTIKSGPNWGNNQQIKRMKSNFSKAKKILRSNRGSINISAINGCCYGKDNNPDKGEYFKYCGERFRTFISGENALYLDIIEPLGYKAKIKNDNYLKEYSNSIHRITKEFINDFCDASGQILWNKLVHFNSGKNNP